MTKVERFEDFQVWQMAHELSITVYGLAKTGEFSRDWGLRDQIQRAVVSVMSNIAEGFERYSRQEFKQFLSISRGSCAEVRSQIQLARSLGYITEEEFTKLYGMCFTLSRSIGGLRSSLERSAKNDIALRTTHYALYFLARRHPKRLCPERQQAHPGR